MSVIKKLRTALLIVLGLALLGFIFRPIPTRQTKPNRIPVRFWHMWSAEWQVVVENIVKRYNESQDKYEVIPLSVPGAGADTKVLLSTIGGDPPDVMAQWNPVIPTWADNKLLTPLDELMTPEEKERFEREAYPVVKKVGTYKGRLYGMCIGLNGTAMYYLPDHLRKAGLDPDHFPETLEEMTRWADKLNKFNDKGELVQLGYLPSGLSSMSEIFGGGFYDWKKGEVTIDTPQNIAALEYIVNQRKKLGFENVVRYLAGLDVSSFAGGWPFIGGSYSMTMNGPYRVEQMAKYAPDLDYRTAYFPPPKGGRKFAGLGGGNFMIIPTSAKQKEGAWDFVKFWSGLENPEVAAEFYCWGGWLPLSPAVAKAPIYQDYLRKYPQFKTFVDQMPSENQNPLPPVAYQVFLADQISKTEDAATRGTLTPREALKQMRLAVEKELARRKALGYED